MTSTMTKSRNGNAPAAETVDSWSIDVDITQRERREFQQASVKAAESGDDSIVYPYLAKFIKAWPYTGNPGNPDAYDDLKISQFAEVVRRVGAAFQRLVEG